MKNEWLFTLKGHIGSFRVYLKCHNLCLDSEDFTISSEIIFWHLWFLLSSCVLFLTMKSFLERL